MSSSQVWTPLPSPVPKALLARHVGIIMDGNGRWARRQGLLRVRGHEAGAEAVREVVRYSSRVGLKVLTLYAFSTENWQRPRKEVSFLMNLLNRYLEKETAELHRENVRITTIGNIGELPAKSRTILDKSMRLTAQNSGLVLCLALNYGSHAELVKAAQQVAGEARAGTLKPEDLTVEDFEARLFTGEFPPVDLLIRTAGEQRVSNFLMWQASSAVFHGIEKCWPEFGPAELEAALVVCASQPLGEHQVPA